MTDKTIKQENCVDNKDLYLIAALILSAVLMLATHAFVVNWYYLSYLDWTPTEIKIRGLSPWFNLFIVAFALLCLLAIVKIHRIGSSEPNSEPVSEPVDEVQHFYLKIAFFLCFLLGLSFFLGAVFANTDLGAVCYQGCWGVLP